MSHLRASDGVRLLTIDEVAERAGVSRPTINQYNSMRHYPNDPRRSRGPMSAIPRPVRKVRRTVLRGNGRPTVIWSWLWREDDIDAWVARRKEARA